ncbi:methionine synthase [Myxococcota bacterium]|nr:methionine synthase [Myxococcota bacterium]
MSRTDSRSLLSSLMKERILVLDGAMGTMIQRYRLGEADYRGAAFASHPRALKGCNDLLALTRPDVIEEIHLAYFDAGADIVETDSFNATSVSMEDYGLEDRVLDINLAAARIARQAAEKAMARDPSRPRFVAGSIGPTTKTASLSPDVNDPALRSITFDALVRAFYEQVDGLVQGGVDLLLSETNIDTLNLKAALFAIEQYFCDKGTRLPVFASVTIPDRSGRTLSGQTIEAFWTSIEHADLAGVAINCALGAEDMRPHVEALSQGAPVPLLVYPNAGLPNEMGEYDDTPESMARVLGDFAARGWINVAGGCCGTTPEHVRAIAREVARHAPRVPPAPSPNPRWSGLERYEIFPGANFTMVGERTNVTGSKRFRELVLAGDYEGAVAVARSQVEGGANVLDVNMDEGLLDAEAAISTFLNQIASEPDVARLPVMIDSSRFSVIEAGLKCVQGKSIVNSISLKEGEEEFLRQARLVRRYGASVVVMGFDEHGQATEVEHRIRIAERAFRLLVEEAGFKPHDVIFDPNVLAIGTGIEEHDAYAVNFIEAARGIKERCPGALISGGVSNLSFGFRGNNRVREAIHAVFLYHAIRGGMDMGIVNAGQLAAYDEIPRDLLEHVEDLVLNRRPDATERLVGLAATLKGKGKGAGPELAWRQAPLAERVAHALLTGTADHVEQDMEEALAAYPQPLDVIEGPLMAGMGAVGDLFGAGKMFLPQVVKSARVMKKAVAVLEPHMERGEGGHSAGRIVVATVKGDVHDIGKNIVGVVLRCNNYDVVDLGVMVPAEKILDAAQEIGADAVGLSGLITPSLDEMVHVAKEMERRGMKVPLLIGGATTSQKHTAVRIAPCYSAPVVHVQDASRSAPVVGRLMNAEERGRLDAENRAEQARLRERYESRRSQSPLLPLTAARAAREVTDWTAYAPPRPESEGERVVLEAGVRDLIPYIDWAPFFHAWEFRGDWRRNLEDPEKGEKARELYHDAGAMLEHLARDGALRARAVYGFFPAASEGDDVVVYRDAARDAERCRFPMLRQQERRGDGPQRCLADWIAPREGGVPDWIGAFVVTAGIGADALAARHEAAHDPYSAIMVKALADRLAEAFTEVVHQRMRREWGFGRDEDLSPEDLRRERYRGIRPAPGYPACPDHTGKRTLFAMLGAEEATGVRLTESCAMWPAASVSGLVLSHPASRYFAVGRIGRDQVESYAQRRGTAVGEVERWLAPWLGYEAGE